MNGSVFQLTLRRWVEILTNPRFYLVFVIVVICCVAMGPFGTYDRMDVVHRFGFWTFANTLCWGVGLGLLVPIRIYLESLGYSRVKSSIAANGVSNLITGSLLVSVLIWALDVEFSWRMVVEFLFFAAPMVVVITYLIILFIWEDNFYKKAKIDEQEKKPIWADPENCAVQQKLSTQNRGVILSMVAQDHYVDIITDKGSELLLMRLSDAVEVCDDDNSLRIHRSAWVSRSGIAKVEKEGRSTKVVLSNGRRLPVARSMETNLAELMKREPCTKGPG